MEHHELGLKLIIEQILFRADLSLQCLKVNIQGPEAGSVEVIVGPRRQALRKYSRQEALFLIIIPLLPKFSHFKY